MSVCWEMSVLWQRFLLLVNVHSKGLPIKYWRPNVHAFFHHFWKLWTLSFEVWTFAAFSKELQGKGKNISRNSWNIRNFYLLRLVLNVQQRLRRSFEKKSKFILGNWWWIGLIFALRWSLLLVEKFVEDARSCSKDCLLRKKSAIYYFWRWSAAQGF